MSEEKTVLAMAYKSFYWEVKTKKEKFVLTEVESVPPTNKKILNVIITFCTLAEAEAYINERIKSKKVCWCKDEPLGHPMFEDCLDN